MLVGVTAARWLERDASSVAARTEWLGSAANAEPESLTP
jgi:hypothetical protein